MEQIRAFIAVELPDEVKSALARLEDELKSGGRFGVKWVDPYGIHMTLKFLGNIAADRVAEITVAMAEAAAETSPLHLELNGLGVFPNSRKAQVAWVGLGGDVDGLAGLQRRLESGLAELGFPPENRSFQPHLTLARVRSQTPPQERQSFGEMIAGAAFQCDAVIDVDAVSLMKSRLTPQGAIYTRIGSAGLEKPLSTGDA